MSEIPHSLSGFILSDSEFNPQHAFSMCEEGMQVWTKMTKRSAAPVQARPQALYKHEFLERILAMSPTSMLDVGCGEGALLRLVGEAGCAHCVGLEPDEEVVQRACAAGLDVHTGRAERLPFPDRSFDVVVFEYVAHHLEHLQRSLLEAAQVASRAVIVLDCWYDETFVSQQVARDYDAWFKRIDRRLGMVHNPCPALLELAAPYLSLSGFELDLACRLVLHPVSIEAMVAKAEKQLALADDAPEFARQLSAILDRARLHGMTDDGAVLLTAKRHG